MTTKTLTGTYAAGYALHSPVTTLNVAYTAYVAGSGITTPSNANVAYTIVDLGVIQAGQNQTYNTTGSGVDLEDGGSVTQGSASATGLQGQGEISGGNGVSIRNAVGTVTNFGMIFGANSSLSYAGIYLSAGGGVTNGSNQDTAAIIEGYCGIQITGASGTVANFGLVQGKARPAIFLADGGAVTNGSISDSYALIVSGGNAISISGAAGTVSNFGTIEASERAGDYGIRLTAGGVVTNGSATDKVALIEGGYGGIRSAGGAASVINFGTMQGSIIWEASLQATDRFANGSKSDTDALVKGWGGVSAGTVVNYGTIIGTGGVAIQLRSSSSVLVVEGGSRIVGLVSGEFGTLELGSGVGTLTAFLPDGNVVLAGSPPSTTFSQFGTVKIDAPASFALTNGSTIGTGQALIVAGTATTTGLLTIAGTLTTSGAIAGTGTLVLNGGTSTFNTGTALTIAKVVENGAAAVAVIGSKALTYAGKWTQTAGTVSVAAGDRISFSGVGDSFASTLAGAGTVAFTGGTDALTHATLSANSVIISGAAVTLSGAITIAHTASVTSPNITIAAAGASLTGGGSVSLSSLATNEVIGATASATLTNVNDKILGAGNIGGGLMTLANDTGGLIDGNSATVGLTIDTGGATIANSGIIENTGAAGTTINSAVNNTGTLSVFAGTLVVAGAVGGAGAVRVAGGTADFASTFSENVAFTGTTGVLVLANSKTYTGKISGFSHAGTTSLDLLDIGFTSGVTTASFSGTTASGTLTVTDGTNTANISLTGNYTASTFTVSSDGHGGTTVVDPTKPGGTHIIQPIQPLVAAMAGFGAHGAAVTAAAEAWRGSIAVLTMSGTHLA